MEREGHLMHELDIFSIEIARYQFHYIILAHMKMEAKKFHINL